MLRVKLKRRPRSQLVSCYRKLCVCSVASPALSVVFRESGFCRQTLASVLYYELSPLSETNLSMGEHKKAVNRNSLNFRTLSHVARFSGRFHTGCNKATADDMHRTGGTRSSASEPPALGRRLQWGG